MAHPRFRVLARVAGVEHTLRTLKFVKAARTFAEEQVLYVAEFEERAADDPEVVAAIQRIRVFTPTDFVTVIIGSSTVRLEAVD
ncbi:hypothetical protein BAJUN_00840 [Bajunvirus bajun]|uniref:Uncharacterized protein n=1 Tax=Brevundimonas phage vB_BgoS-Bajun TaxID=2948594 RepID=A0A9E7N7C3_9CAUD|nr:hypothetical protein BAJUN_00840 [Brevundimonas phage vB_BgoS-Bajun]